MARKRVHRNWKKHFGHVAKICAERARKGLEKYQHCMKRML